MNAAGKILLGLIFAPFLVVGVIVAFPIVMLGGALHELGENVWNAIRRKVNPPHNQGTSRP